MSHYRGLQSVSKTELVEAFYDPSINLVTFPEPDSPRPLPEVLQTALEPIQFWLLNEPWKEGWAKVENGLRGHFDLAVADRMLTHTHDLLTTFTGFTGDEAPFISLRTVDKEYIEKNGVSVSAGYHRDASFFTLQHTLAGETLQWTPNDNVRREYFDSKQIQPSSDPDNLVVFDPHNYKSVPQRVVAILRGELRADETDADTIEFLGNFIDNSSIPDFNRNGGLIHRGDKTTRNGRMVLTISTHQKPEWIPN